MEINKRTELENIAINHSADIDYKDLWKFTGNVQENRFLFLTFTCNWSPKIRKNLLPIYKNDSNWST